MDEDQGTTVIGNDHMSATAGTVSHDAGSDLPYKVVLAHQGTACTEHFFATMRESEAFIRANTPVPPARSTVFDHNR